VIVNRNFPIYSNSCCPSHPWMRDSRLTRRSTYTTTTTMLPMLSVWWGSHRGISLKLHLQTLEWLVFRRVCSTRPTIRWFYFHPSNEPCWRLNTRATSSRLLFGKFFPFNTEFLIPAQRNHADGMLRRNTTGKRCQITGNRSNNSLCERLSLCA
jgi:hypothetical protein